MRIRNSSLALMVIATAYACEPASENVVATDKYAAAVANIESFIRVEMEDKALPAFSVVLVDDQETVWAAGFGLEDIADSVTATAATVYRVGSVSKLFTDIGVMQLVERGELDLDVPITRYLPNFSPVSSFDGDITLRQLMSHRSGLVREPPIGHYFDDSNTSLAQTVASMSQTALVYPQESRTKYSNAGIATVGYVLEAVNSEPFARYLKGAVLEPIGMDGSSLPMRLCGPITVQISRRRPLSWVCLPRAACTPRLPISVSSCTCFLRMVWAHVGACYTQSHSAKCLRRSLRRPVP